MTFGEVWKPWKLCGNQSIDVVKTVMTVMTVMTMLMVIFIIVIIPRAAVYNFIISVMDIILIVLLS